MNFKKNSQILETFLLNNGIMRINLNDPTNLNALSEKMIDHMQIELDKAAINKDVKVIIISGEGQTFSSGHDLKELKSGRSNADKGKSFFPDFFLIFLLVFFAKL